MSKTTGARMDSHRVRLRTGEGQRKDGSYCFRWTDSSGQRRSLYAPTLQELRMKEDEVLREKAEGLRTDGRYLTVNDLFARWKELKRGLRDSSMRNYVYMYETYVAPNFGRTRRATAASGRTAGCAARRQVVFSSLKLFRSLFVFLLFHMAVDQPEGICLIHPALLKGRPVCGPVVDVVPVPSPEHHMARGLAHQPDDVKAAVRDGEGLAARRVVQIGPPVHIYKRTAAHHRIVQSRRLDAIAGGGGFFCPNRPMSP